MSYALPIAAYRDEIVAAVRNNSVVVITAETGAGKSTQVPQYLLEEGYELVITQPRRLAARTVAQRVAEELDEELGGLVGYRTAVDRVDSDATRALFCIDGLALVRELMGANKGVLVLDEVHEWSENMEVLVAWARRQIEAGVDFKLVLMSATMEAGELAAFFSGAPVIKVPGRLYPVEEQKPGSSLENDVARLVREGRNVLVFQPGKAEIEQTIAALRQMRVGAEILPLHGQLDAGEQARCFRHYGRPKVVVSTNVAQTSVTIDDIDAVVDSGQERRIELIGGVEGLYLKPVSLADSTQRRGRAGRTKPGIYIDHCSASMRPDFPVAEILRRRLDQTVLRLAVAGFDMEELDFFHQPDRAEIRGARKALIGLGCMRADGSVTPAGKLVNKLPVSVQYGRMLIEANRLGVVDDVLTVVAILEVGGITVKPPSRTNPDRPDWRHMVPEERESDVLGQLAVWRIAVGKSANDKRKRGVSIRDYERAKEIRKQLTAAIRRHMEFSSTGRREDILKAVCAGMVGHLYQGGYGDYRNSEGDYRQLGASSLVRGAEWIVGQPFDLQIKARRGGTTMLRLIELASKVDPVWLVEVAPHLVTKEVGISPRYDAERGYVVSTTRVLFNGTVVGEELVVDDDHPEAPRVFAAWLAGQVSAGKDEVDAVLRANAERQQRARELNLRSGHEVFPVYTAEEVVERFCAALLGVKRMSELAQPSVLALPALDEGPVASILRDNPDVIEILGRERVVEYRVPSGGVVPAPRVGLSEECVVGNSWLALSDDGYRLPGGRLIEVSVTFGFHATISDTSIPALKDKMREHLNRGQWGCWARPDIPVPDMAADSAEIPLEVASYGTCIVTGLELKAYGTLRARHSLFGRDSLTWETVWYADELEAQDAANAAARVYVENLAQAKAAKARELVEAEARRVQLETDAEDRRELAELFDFVNTLDEARMVRQFAETVRDRWILTGALDTGTPRVSVERQLNDEQREVGAVYYFLWRLAYSQVNTWIEAAIAWLDEHDPVDEATFDMDAGLETLASRFGSRHG